MDMKFDKDTIANSILAYSLPGSTEFILATISSIENSSELNLSEFDFVFSPFRKENNTRLLFKISSKASGRKFSVKTNKTLNQVSTSRQEYEVAFNQAKKLILTNELQKLVLSKIKV